MREHVLPPAAESVATARRMTREFLRSTPWVRVVDEVELAVSELATNAVVHAGTEFVLRVSADGNGVRVEVADGNTHAPAPRDYAATARTGRGLRMVEQVADRWGVTLTPDGKAVWFEFGRPGEASVRPRGSIVVKDTSSDVQVCLRNVPVLMHWAWQEHAQALLREYLLFRLEEDPAVLEQHAEASEALSILYEQVPLPSLPEDPDGLLAETLEPEVSAEQVAVTVPRASVGHFAVLDEVLSKAVEAAASGQFLGPPTQPEIEEMRRWLCAEVARQADGTAEPQPWRTRTDVRSTVGDPAELLRAYAELTDTSQDVLVTDEASVIVAVSDSVATFLGYRSPADLVGRRIIVVVPHRYHQAHIAGTTLNATNGRDVLLGVRITVPVLKADGTEVLVGLRVTGRTLRETRVFVADMDLP